MSLPVPTPLQQEISPNTFLTIVPPPSSSSSTSSSSSSDIDTPPLIFFIPGNPGLVGYYHLFLSLLARDLVSFSSSFPSSPSEKAKTGGNGFVVYGRSMAGFDVNCDVESEITTGKGRWEDKRESSQPSRLYGLSEQIEFMEGKLGECVHRWRDGSVQGKGKKKKAKVILLGHSVGAYVAMEILRRWREREDEDDETMEIIGGIMLFPTVVDIAKSVSGRKMSTLLNIPYLDAIASTAAKTLTFVLPDSALRWIVGSVMRNPREDAVDTTMAFLKSKCGVQQAIYMAADEMRDITSDKWDDEMWGTAAPESQGISKLPAKLVFYFGRDDHWVAEQTRDDIIRARGSKVAEVGGSPVQGPKMVVCEDNVVHGFCIGHSEIMALKVASFIRSILQERGS